MEMLIEKNIPIPPKNPQVSYKDVLTGMEVGDSIFFPGTSYLFLNEVKSMLQFMGRRVTIRAVIVNDVSGIRLWRIE